MKKILFFTNILVIAGMIVSCGESASKELPCPDESTPYVISTTEIFVPADSVNDVPEYTIFDKTQVNLNAFPQDDDGFIILFCGKSLYGWRGYNRDNIPGRWVIDEEEGALKFTGSGGGEAQELDGGDLIFGYKFSNFELSIDWKCSKGANSGIFYLAQEIKGEPIYISSPESQVLDNENHPDARMGQDGNRKSTSLYDMIPANPQNAKPFGEWNNTTIIVYRGTVLHQQNGENVLEYHLWTPQWTNLLQNSKFRQGSREFPLAFELLNNCGGANREGYIGLQDHGDDVWFRNIKIKILD